MLTLLTTSLIAAGLAVLVFWQALRGAGDGHEDELGFHGDRKARKHSRPTVSSSPEARARLSRAAHAGHH